MFLYSPRETLQAAAKVMLAGFCEDSRGVGGAHGIATPLAAPAPLTSLKVNLICNLFSPFRIVIQVSLGYVCYLEIEMISLTFVLTSFLPPIATITRSL